MFKFAWVVILAIVWFIWAIVSVINLKECFISNWKYLEESKEEILKKIIDSIAGTFEDAEIYSIAFIGVTIFCSFFASFIYFFISQVAN